MFEYAFMIRAMWVGVLISFMAPLLGQTLVLRRMSMVSDAIAHSTLAGISIGLIIGINPLIAAILTSILAIMTIDKLRQKLPDYAEVSVSILMAIGIGLAGTLSSFVDESANFMSFLFGSIVATSAQEVLWMTIIAILVFALYFLFYKEIFALTFDENQARYDGINIKLINFVFMIMLGLTLSIAAKTVGSLILSSLLIIPVASSLQFSKSYASNLRWSMVFSFISMFSGLTLSFYFGLKPGGAVVLIAVIIYLIILPIKSKLK